jgi:phenylacetate-CoA ligase
MPHAQSENGAAAELDWAFATGDVATLRKIRERRLRRTIELCATAHPFYRQRFSDIGIKPQDLTTLDDLKRLPLVHKSDYMAAPENFRLQLADVEGVSVEEKTLWNVAYTTGTTSGKPSPFFNTSHDQFNIMLQARICAEAEGYLPTDVLANLIPLSSIPTGGFLVVGRTAEAFGIPIISALTGAKNPNYPIHRGLDAAIDRLALANPSVFWSIPSFARRFFRRVRERGAKFPRARMAILTGEPVSASLQLEIADHLKYLGAQDPQVRVRYSFTEMQGGLVRCCNGAALQNVVPELYYLEVVDPANGEPLPEGQEGALALTHLHRRGTVLLRYLVGDIVAFKLDHCPHCGRLGERIVSSPRRTGALLKVKGMLINPELVFDHLSADRAIREFQLVVRNSVPGDPDSMDALVLRLEAEQGAEKRLAAELPVTVQKITMVRPEIEFARPGELHDPMKSTKAKRVIDERLAR